MYLHYETSFKGLNCTGGGGLESVGVGGAASQGNQGRVHIGEHRGSTDYAR